MNQSRSAIGAQYDLINCRVTSPHVEMKCEVPAAVGYNQTWQAVVGGQISNDAPNFKASFDPPNITSIEVEPGYLSLAAGSDADIQRLDTVGGDWLKIVGSNFGPIGPTNNVHAASFSEECGEDCVAATLLDFTGRAHPTTNESFLSHLSRPVAERYNFKATSCNVTEADTTMVCVVGPGVGRNHAWMVVVGGQASAFFLGANSSYASPTIATLNPVAGPTFHLETYPTGKRATAATRVTLRGRYFGRAALGVATVFVSVRVERIDTVGGVEDTAAEGAYQDYDGGACTYASPPVPNSCAYEREELNVTVTLQQKDGEVVFDMPPLTYSQDIYEDEGFGLEKTGTKGHVLYNPFEFQDAKISIAVGGVRMALGLDASDVKVHCSECLTFRYYTVGNIDPAITAKSADDSCLASDILTVHGHGFLTEAQYDADFKSHDTSGTYPNVTMLLGDGRIPGNVENFFDPSYRTVACNVTSSQEVVCPNNPGYQGPGAENEDSITLKPGLSLNGGKSWMTLCSGDGADPKFKYWSSTQESQPEETRSTQYGCIFTYFRLPSVYYLEQVAG